jgi:IgA Peptidase M64
LEQQSGSVIRGFLQTEPIKSNRNKINLWSYEKTLDDFQYSDFQRELATVNNSLSIKYATPIFIKPDPTNNKRSNGSLPYIDYTSNKNIEKYWPGYNTVMYLPKVSYDNSFVDNIPNVLTHEFGHTLFNLADEYFESGNQTPLTRYPNCAPNLDTTKTWWESLVGQEDTVATDILKIQYPQSQYDLFNANFPDVPSYNDFINSYAKDYKVGYYPGGCFADYGIDTGQVRPTETSVMKNENAASFGAVNSREINKVFALFSGENQAISKPLPTSVNITNFQRDYNKYLESPDCKNILKPNNKKYLQCSFLTKQGKTLSNSPLFKLELTDPTFDNEDNIYNPNPASLATSNCTLSDNKIVCDDIVTTSLDFNKNVNLWFNFGENARTYILTKEESIKGEENIKRNLKLNYFDTIDLNSSIPNSTGGVITITVKNNVESPSIKLLINNSTSDEVNNQNQTLQLSPKSTQDSNLTENISLNKEEIKAKDLHMLTRTGGYDFGLILCILIFTMSLIRFRLKSKIDTKLV